jgi:thiosulfate/3-mercaptopyruvate sulfurtransferase
MLASSRKFARAFCGKRNMIASFSSDVAEMKYNPLLQAGEAIALLQQPRIRFVDASFHMDKTRDPTSEYLNERIPGAVRFDIDSVCDKTSPLPHMLPSAEDFSSAMNGLKIENDTHVVLYGAKNALAIPRAWWTFKVFGHNNVSIIG